MDKLIEMLHDFKENPDQMKVMIIAIHCAELEMSGEYTEDEIKAVINEVLDDE